MGGCSDHRKKKPGTIVAKLLNFKGKEEIIRRSYELKGTNFLLKTTFQKKLLRLEKKCWTS